ncbi:hypothetical protein ACIBCT_30785 [Streptosporangium sp. NPDC050855]|uniref:hypothetical protein n=1 Tax=Streptosporangium sp. NPDC050855 TaxID=3366194 RepID=UPI00379F3365
MNLVFIGSGADGLGTPAFARAAALGFTPVLVTADPARRTGARAAGVRVLACDLDSPDSPAALAGRLRHALGEIAGVTAADRAHAVTAARVAARLGLPGNPPEAVTTCADRVLTRRALVAARLPSPAFEPVGPDDDLDARVVAALSRIALPCVVRPALDLTALDLTGPALSVPGVPGFLGTPDAPGTLGPGTGSGGAPGLVLCSTYGEVTAHCRRIVSPAAGTGIPAGTAVIEGRLPGPGFGVETVGAGGFHRCVGITAGRVTAPPHLVERGHVPAMPLPPDRVRTLTATATRALAAVGLTHGAAHVEMRLAGDHAYVVRIDAHPADGAVRASFARECGFDLLDAHLRAVTGLDQLPLPGSPVTAGNAFPGAHPFPAASRARRVRRLGAPGAGAGIPAGDAGR